MSLLRRFSTRVLPPAARNWRTAGHPAPPSLLDDHPDPPDLSEEPPQQTINTVAKSLPRLPTPNVYKAHRARIQHTFPSGWSPPRKLSREAMEGLRLLHHIDPNAFSTPVLADRFRVSPEAVRRILKSKWAPSREEQARIARRERQTKEDAVRKSRMEERMRALAIEKETFERERERERERTNSRGGGGGRSVNGINPRDTFTFQ